MAKPSPIEKLRKVCLALPGAWEKVSHGEPTFWVGQRMFASFADAGNHHGAGRYAVWCKATHATQDLLVSRSPDRYFVPPYAGAAGWVGVYLDRRPAWSEVAERLEHAYQLASPPKRPRAKRQPGGVRH
jgi:predicted DNA-binding protein (MmcQ/YjbR family)